MCDGFRGSGLTHKALIYVFGYGLGITRHWGMAAPIGVGHDASRLGSNAFAVGM